MAGDWIKMRASLTTNPKVTVIAKMLESHLLVGKRLATGHSGALRDIVTRDVTRDVTLASLFRVWCAANDHTSDGVWKGIEISDLDHIAGVPCFGEMMQSVGWAVFDAGNMTVTFPNFLEYNAPAKERKSGSAERMRRYRDRKRNASDVTCDVTESATNRATGCATSDVEKRREELEKNREEQEKNPPKSPKGENAITPEDFMSRWNLFAKKKPKIKGIRTLTKDRRKKIIARLSEDGWFESFKVAITFLPLGETPGSTWQPNLDWLIRNETNACRLAEGEFSWRNADDPAREKRQANLRRIEAEDREARIAEDKRKNRCQIKDTHSAIDSILNQQDGNGGGRAGSSLLSGLDQTHSSASGAEQQRSSSGGPAPRGI